MDDHRCQLERPADDAVDADAVVGDDALVRQFVLGRDGEAFGELVSRHAGLVLSVCRRTLRHEHDAEEAFQATFLVLAQKAPRLRIAATLAPWLYAVAYRIARRAAAKRHRRREGELPDDLAVNDEVLAGLAECHWQRTLDDELHELPERFPPPLVLHYLLGKTNKQIAAELGLSVRAVEGRQRRGKDLLKHRLALRKVSLPAALAAVGAAASTAQATVAPTLVDATVATGLSFITGNSGACAAGAVRIAQSEVLTMTSSLAPMSATMVTLLALGGAFAVAGGDNAGQGGGAPPLVAATASAESVGAEDDGEGGGEIMVSKDSGGAAADAKPDDAFSVFDASGRRIYEPKAEGKAPVARQNSAAERNDRLGLAPSDAIGVSDEVDLYGRSNRERQIYGALATELATPLDFVDTPLNVIAQSLSEEYKVPILFDFNALEAIGSSPEVEVSVQLKGVKLRSALELTLRRVGLAYLVKNEVLLITSPEAAESTLEAHVYDLKKTLSGLSITTTELVEMIPETIDPDTWTVNGGGEGAIRKLGSHALVVNQNQAVHEHIAEFLRQMELHGRRVNESSEGGF